MLLLAAENPDIITTLVGNSPIAGAIIAVIIIFMRHISKTEDRREESERRRLEADEKHADILATIGNDCHQFQKELSEANAQVMNKVIDALAKNSTTLEINTRALNKNTNSGT